MKKIARIISDAPQHWVGDGFPVRSLLSYQSNAREIDPFLLLDYAGPAEFTPSPDQRGVGEHPHRGFETVTIVYQGELEHQDSGGNKGAIGPGDVQWMTAGSGVVHEEFHSGSFSKAGGTFEVIQLWVNLPAASKMTAPQYQELSAKNIPVVTLENDAGTARIIAGNFFGTRGLAKTFTPINLWDIALKPGAKLELPIADGDMSALVVQKGAVTVDGQQLKSISLAIFERSGDSIAIETNQETRLLLMSGKPIEEPVVGHGPFVMNSRAEIERAIVDFQAGRMGRIG